MDLTLKVRVKDRAQDTKARKLCKHSKELYNFANYAIRQEFFQTRNVMSYSQLCYDFKDKVDHENDVPYRRLPSAISQQVLKQLSTNWFSFLRAGKEYRNNPSKFLGQPKPPKCLKVFNIVSMDVGRCIRVKKHKIYFIKQVLNPIRIPRRIFGKKIKLIRLVPHHNIFDLEFVYEEDVMQLESNNRSMAIDLGVNNFVTTVNNAGIPPFIINGKIIKSINQRYNKQVGKLQTRLPKGQYRSNQIEILTLKRENRLRDQLHKISTKIADICLEHKISTLIVGWNDGIKQNSNMGKVNNQKFVQIPFYKFRKMLEYKCQLRGIKYIEVKESYTSKCSYFDREPIKKRKVYAGKRIFRGLFKTNTGQIVNADVNAAYNIHCLATKKRLLNPIPHPIRMTVGSREFGVRCK